MLSDIKTALNKELAKHIFPLPEWVDEVFEVIERTIENYGEERYQEGYDRGYDSGYDNNYCMDDHCWEGCCDG